MQARAMIMAVAGLLMINSIASAEIYQWEYVDPAHPELGKQQSPTLCPDGAGVWAVPLADLSFRNLTQAYLIGSDLTGASFYLATLTNADLSNAVVKRAEFFSTTGQGFTAAQLYSTASYASGDLTGIDLGGDDLTGWDFAGKDLTSADFERAKLTSANLSNAVVKRAYFGNTTLTAAQLYSTASYASGDLTGIGLDNDDLPGWNFAGKNLTDASFSWAKLTNANLSNAVVKGANFEATTSQDFTAAQLYSTASYASGDLTGICLSMDDLTGWKFAGKNLTSADFTFATLTGADFSFADVRGAIGVTSSQWLSTSTRRNAIYTDGTIAGLSLQAADHLVVRNNPIAITVTGIMSLAEGSELEIRLDEEHWGSSISPQAGIPVTLGGTLHLTLADGAEGENLLGRTFDLFNWNGLLSEDNRFGAIVSLPGYLWDTSKLYTTGEVTLTAISLAGDANGDGVVDAADYIILKRNFGKPGAKAQGDLSGDGKVDWADLQILMSNFGAGGGSAPAAAPEPATLTLLTLGGLALIRRRRK